MALVMKLSLLAVLCAAQISLSMQQEMKLFSYCDLSQTGVFADPSIISEEAFASMGRSYPAAAVARALQRSPGRAAYVRGVAQAQGRNAQASAGRSRAKRSVADEFISPTQTGTMCEREEKRILYSLDKGDVCFVVQPQVLTYYDCAQSQCNVANGFPYYQQYRCEPETYVHVTAVVYCTANEPLRDQVFFVPANCCCKKYSCDLANKFNIPRLA